MKRLFLLVALSAPLWAQKDVRDVYNRDIRNWKWSASAVMATATLDAVSTVGGYEANPALGRGQFRMSQQGAKTISITAGIVLAQWFIVHRWPRASRPIAISNYVVAGFRGGMAARNWRLE